MFKALAKRFFIKMAIASKVYAPIKQALVECDESSIIKKGNNVTIKNSSIVLKNGSRLIIEDEVVIDEFNLFLDKGNLYLGKCSIFKKASYLKPEIVINDGTVRIANNCVIRATILCHFEGELKIGQYTGINEETNIRCSEFISIGEFNMISYQCLIFDNNTHEILSPEKRREQTIRDFPFIGAEYNKPISGKVIIGNDVWIGQRATILKGSIIENQAIVATGAIVAGKTIPSRSIAVGNPSRKIDKSHWTD